MLLTIIFVLLIMLGIFLAESFFVKIGITVLSVGVIGTVLCVSCIMYVQIPKQASYEKAVMQRDMLEYRLEHQENGQTGNELLYSDILEFNQDLYSIKKWSKNLWVNWFWNDKIAKLDYINIDKGNIKPEQEWS